MIFDNKDENKSLVAVLVSVEATASNVTDLRSLW